MRSCGRCPAMSANASWKPFGIADERYDEPGGRRAVRVLHLRLGGRREQQDRAATWLRNAMIALGLLAAAAAVVSFEAQYRMVFAAKHVKAIAALEAGIPDVSAVVFAALGIALALQGKRALRPRALNVAAVATSIGMNYLAATAGWRDAAIWVMPSVAYAVASDTAIGVIRAYVLARQRQLAEDLADDETTPLAVVGGLLLWVLRLLLAPKSTLTGFRSWVVEEVKVAPGRRATRPGGSTNVAALPAAPTPGTATGPRSRKWPASWPPARALRGVPPGATCTAILTGGPRHERPGDAGRRIRIRGHARSPGAHRRHRAVRTSPAVGADRRRNRGRGAAAGLLVGVPGAAAAEGPGPVSAGPGPAAAVPGPWVGHGVRVVAAVGPAGGAAGQRAHPAGPVAG